MDELASILANPKSGTPLSEAEAQRQAANILKTFDANGDGKLQYDEFVEVVAALCTFPTAALLTCITCAQWWAVREEQNKSAGVVNNLLARFPNQTMEQIQSVLEQTGGHAGRAVNLLSKMGSAVGGTVAGAVASGTR